MRSKADEMTSLV